MADASLIPELTATRRFHPGLRVPGLSCDQRYFKIRVCQLYSYILYLVHNRSSIGLKMYMYSSIRFLPQPPSVSFFLILISSPSFSYLSILHRGAKLSTCENRSRSSSHAAEPPPSSQSSTSTTGRACLVALPRPATCSRSWHGSPSMSAPLWAGSDLNPGGEVLLRPDDKLADSWPPHATSTRICPWRAWSKILHGFLILFLDLFVRIPILLECWMCDVSVDFLWRNMYCIDFFLLQVFQIYFQNLDLGADYNMEAKPESL